VRELPLVQQQVKDILSDTRSFVYTPAGVKLDHAVWFGSTRILAVIAEQLCRIADVLENQ
jgi:hypothetical protein